MTTEILELKCSRCKETKPVAEFSKNRAAKTGYQDKCKPCQKTYTAERASTKVTTELKCADCGEIKPVSQFYKNRRMATGYTSYCKVCRAIRDKDNLESRREYRNQNKDRINSQKRKAKEKERGGPPRDWEEYRKARRAETEFMCGRCGQTLPRENFYKCESNATGCSSWCKECDLSTHKDYYQKNRERLLENDKLYRTENKNSLSQYASERRRSNNDIRLKQNLRSRIRHAIVKRGHSALAIEYLGCDIDTAVTHIESLFSDNMSWGNYGSGKDKWNIDHIAPISSFDLEDTQHLLLACHYLNLQPMWYLDNIRKSDKMPDVGIESFGLTRQPDTSFRITDIT